MYVITGATGNTGHVVAQKLLDEGQPVKVISRSPEKVQHFVDQGASKAIGDLSDTGFVKEAFQDATAVYAVIPPRNDPADFRAYQQEIGENIAKGLGAKGINKVVVLSSFGAHLPEGTGVVNGLYDFEQRLNQIDNLDVLSLRAGFFLQNFYANLPLLKSQNILGGFPFRADVQLPMVHTADIGEIAAQRLKNRDFYGFEVQEIAGAKDYSMNEAAKILETNLGLSGVQYVPFSYEDARQGMMQMGMSENLADNYVTFTKAVNEGRLYEGYQRTAANTTSRTLEDFAANELAQAFQQVA